MTKSRDWGMLCCCPKPVKKYHEYVQNLARAHGGSQTQTASFLGGSWFENKLVQNEAAWVSVLSDEVCYDCTVSCWDEHWINIVAAFRGMHESPAKHSSAWLPRKCDYRTDRRRTRWSPCTAMLRRRHRNVRSPSNKDKRLPPPPPKGTVNLLRINTIYSAPNWKFETFQNKIHQGTQCRLSCQPNVRVLGKLNKM